MIDHDGIREEVAVYALGSLPSVDAARVRVHLLDCPECTLEYQGYVGVTGILAREAQSIAPVAIKERLMERIRGSALKRPTLLWPAYLVAAAAFALAIISSVADLSLEGRLHTTAARLAESRQRAHSLATEVDSQRRMLADLAGNAARIALRNGEVIVGRSALYLDLQHLPAPPHGHIYQAWMLKRGETRMQPSSLFAPDHHGNAFVALPVNATADVAVVAVSIEPRHGSLQPTTAPVLVAHLE